MCHYHCIKTTTWNYMSEIAYGNIQIQNMYVCWLYYNKTKSKQKNEQKFWLGIEPRPRVQSANRTTRPKSERYETSILYIRSFSKAKLWCIFLYVSRCLYLIYITVIGICECLFRVANVRYITLSWHSVGGRYTADRIRNRM
jgi:hypothetical protein